MIDAKTKQRIFKANVANVVRKVRAGKPLSQPELDLIARAEEEEKGGQAAAHDTIASAASYLGVSKTLISNARAAGLPGFKGSRVYLRELLPALPAWMEKTGGFSAAEKLEDEIRKERLRQARFETDREMGLYLRKSEFESWCLRKGEQVKGVVGPKLKAEIVKWEGLRAPEMLAKAEPLIAELVELLRAQLK